MERERAVPWESWQQWRHVRASIFSHSPPQIAHALDQVSAWQSRGSLPVAVEITAELISIHQRDPHMNAEVSADVALPGEMLRMMYAMAIMRLVNGVVDQSVRRSTFSVANRAEDANLPRVFVDIRHETSHNELPSLPLVRHASKQALAWLQKSYWEEQEQLLPDTQGTLRSKLVEHAQVVFEMLGPQQKLLSKGQDYKQENLNLKRALKGMKQQQQALLRELLELGTTSKLVSLLVEEGLLVHNLNTPRDDDENHRFSDVDEAPDSPSSSNSEGSTLDYSSAAWKQTFLQLAEHLPQFPALLLSSICEALITEETPSFSKEELVEWATWILDQSSTSSSTKKKDGVGSVLFPQDSLKEVALLCVRSGRLEKEALGKVVAHLAPLISDDCLRRRVEVLARCGVVNDNVESGSRFGSEADSIISTEEFSVDTSSLKKARELQQTSIAKYIASMKKSANSATQSAGPWSKAKTWTPCAIGMLPSIGTEAVVPEFDMNQGSEPADLKRKALEVTPGVDLKRMRAQDQLMSEEEQEKEAEAAAQMDQETRGNGGCEPMDEDQPLADEDQVFVKEEQAFVDEDQELVDEDQPQEDADKFTVMWQGFLLQNGVLSQLQELPNLQAAIRVL